MFFIANAGRKSKGYIAKKTLFSKEKTKAVSIVIGIPHFVYPRPFPDPGKMPSMTEILKPMALL